VTLTDAKREAWFADLANPDVPLQRLGNSVPHGAKGQDLLDLLQTNNVAIPRAVWFLRVFGANETVRLHAMACPPLAEHCLQRLVSETSHRTIPPSTVLSGQAW